MAGAARGAAAEAEGRLVPLRCLESVGRLASVEEEAVAREEEAAAEEEAAESLWLKVSQSHWKS